MWDASFEARELLRLVRVATASDSWVALHEVLGARMRIDEGVFSTTEGHGHLVMRLVALHALELELRPRQYGKGSDGFVRANDAWLEELERDEVTVEVALWAAEATADAARAPEEAAHKIRRLMTADAQLSRELEDAERAFVDGGGVWSELEPEVRDWVRRRRPPPARVPPPADVRPKRVYEKTPQKPSGVETPPPTRVHHTSSAGGAYSAELGSGPDRRRRLIMREGDAGGASPLGPRRAGEPMCGSPDGSPHVSLPGPMFDDVEDE